MTSSRSLALLLLAGLVFAAGAADADAPAPPDEAAQIRQLPDEAIDAVLFKDHDGVQGSGERSRLLAELSPELFARSRQLRRRLHFARPEDRAAIASEMIDHHTRIGNWLNRESRHVPLDALDALLAIDRANLAELERTDPTFCGPDIWGVETANYASRQALPQLTVTKDIAAYRAVAAARSRPANHRPIDEAMGEAFVNALKAAGVSEQGIGTILFGGDGFDGLTPPERCDLSRRMMAAFASLPDDVRGPLLAFQLSGHDAGDR